MASHQLARSFNSLPVETLHEIVLYLPRHSLRGLLLLQPHPLGQVASYVYFSTLSLRFGICQSYLSWCVQTDDPSTLWHQKRSIEILEAIINDANFASRVKRLNLSAVGDSSELLDLLRLALPKLTRLQTLECSGGQQFRRIIEHLPQAIPHLKTLRLSGNPSNLYMNAGDSSGGARLHQLQHLDQLIICEGWQEFVSPVDLPQDLKMLNIKKLYLGTPCINLIGVSITPAFTNTLTHLWLTTTDSDSISPYAIVLRYGVNLKSLRIEGVLVEPSSQHFRRYSHALPFLTEFGVDQYGAEQDADFFPAVCDFIRLKARQLVHLELRTTINKYISDRLGFKECWDMFRSMADRTTAATSAVSFPQLETLSMTLPGAIKNLTLHYSNLIPKSVTSLCLSGNCLSGKSIKQLFKIPQTKKSYHKWPPNLRSISIDFDQRRTSAVDLTQVQMMAECIPTLQTLRSGRKSLPFCQLWTIRRDEAGNITKCEMWNWWEKSTEQVLDRFGCEDIYFDW